MRISNYDKLPCVAVAGFESDAWRGYTAIGEALCAAIQKKGQARTVVAVDCYPGLRDDEVLPALQSALHPAVQINASEAMRSNEDIQTFIEHNLTEDRVRGVLSVHKMAEFIDPEKQATLRSQIEGCERGIVLVYGVGASLLCEADLVVYADLARWEIQLRYRSGELANWCADNYGEDFLRMYKRAFFVDWRVADRHKVEQFDQIDFWLDTNTKNDPKMVSSAAFRRGMETTAKQPFRVVPYFDPAPWGGQWMKDVCDLDKSQPNFGWAFDCVPEENSLLLQFGAVQMEVPSINLVLFQPQALLGEKVYGRFGAEFPIRFDFLDTMGGGNLSLQVHPTTEYIQQHFGMHYTQDESYYILEAGDDSVVYLGLRDDIVPAQMISDLEQAQAGGDPFDAEKHVNKIPAKKHDHFLIPAGTVHCSGNNTMVLEVSATPYIFTFKLWDWGRLGMDGKPRPIHLEHGKEVINWDWTTSVVEQTHVNCVEKIDCGEGWREERTGLHEREFIETRRHWFVEPVLHHTNGGVNVLNLVEGDEVVVESPTGAFEPFEVHYAETFIIPAAVGAYSIRPTGISAGKECATLKAYVRT